MVRQLTTCAKEFELAKIPGGSDQHNTERLAAPLSVTIKLKPPYCLRNACYNEKREHKGEDKIKETTNEKTRPVEKRTKPPPITNAFKLGP